MNKVLIIGFSILGIFTCGLLFQNQFVKEFQVIEEIFADKSPKKISVYNELFGYRKKIREIEFWLNGDLRYDRQIKNNNPEGLQIFFPESGGKVSQYINNGKRHGLYTEWDSILKITKQELWESGKLVKIIIPSDNSK